MGSPTFYVAEAMERMFKKDEFAVCICNVQTMIWFAPNNIQFKNCPNCQRNYSQLEQYYLLEIPKLVQAERDAYDAMIAAKKGPSSGPSGSGSTPVFNITNKVGGTNTFKIVNKSGGVNVMPSVFALFRDHIHAARYADTSHWDLTAVDKHGVVILVDDMTTVLKEYDIIYNAHKIDKTKFLDEIRHADEDDKISELIRQIKDFRDK